MIKRLLIMLNTLLLITGIPCTPASAQDANDVAEKDAATTIPDMLAEVEYVTKAKPKKKALVYYFLRSSSKCGYCVAMCGANNAAYKEMKGKGAELILLNCDTSTETAKSWAEKASMKYPVVSPDTKGKINVPSGGSGGLPNLVVVTADGSVVESVSGMTKCKELYSKWKDFVKEAKKAEREKRKEAEKAKATKKKNKKSKDTSGDDADNALEL